jgi:hypothetical protein
MMHPLCWLFGHKSGQRNRYGRLVDYATDGIGRVHLFVYVACQRCGDEFQCCMVHLPQKYVPAAKGEQT